MKSRSRSVPRGTGSSAGRASAPSSPPFRWSAISRVAALALPAALLLCAIPGFPAAPPASKEKTASDTQATSPTAKNGAAQGMQLFELGDLGGSWANVYLGQLRGEPGKANATLSNGDFSYLNMVGLIRIESERLNLECENLDYDKTNQKLDARYNVHVVLHQEEVDARCGHLVYDLGKNVIVLTVDPHVIWNSEKGQAEAYNMDSLTITLKPNNQNDIAIVGSKTVMRMRTEPGAGGAKNADTPTTPLAPVEILPNAPGPGLLTGPTPTPAAKRK